MDCHSFKMSLRGYLEKELDLQEILSFEGHQKECPQCEQLLRQSQEITCREAVDFIIDYLEDALAASQREVFQRHLEICPECVDYLDSYQKTILLGREAFCEGEDELAGVPETLIQAILKARRADPE